MKGGYQIIDLGGINLTANEIDEGAQEIVKGVYEKIEGTDKPVLIQNYSVDGIEEKPFFGTLISEDLGFAVYHKNYKITFLSTATDAVLFESVPENVEISMFTRQISFNESELPLNIDLNSDSNMGVKHIVFAVINGQVLSTIALNVDGELSLYHNLLVPTKEDRSAKTFDFDIEGYHFLYATLTNQVTITKKS